MSTHRFAQGFGTAVTLVILLIVGLVIATSSSKHVTRMYTTATLSDTGAASIHESIGYDFGSGSSHGIYRDVPSVIDSTVEVRSPDAPDVFEVNGDRIRIGDPDTAVSGAHRYTVDYALPTLIAENAALLTSFAANDAWPWLYLPIALAAATTGVGIGLCTWRNELRIRTAQGSGLYLRAESFRRFLHESEAQHVEYAAKHNLLREYTAWAVAVGEVKRWNTAMQNSSLEPAQYGNDFAMVYIASSLVSSANSAVTTPSSSGSGGSGFSGGGFSGGGGGGGGGGSW